jgi:hypothetical protein
MPVDDSFQCSGPTGYALQETVFGAVKQKVISCDKFKISRIGLA